MTHGAIPPLRALVGLFVLLCATGGMQAAAGDSAWMPVDDIRPGMRGTGLTVFEGNRIEEFGVEILGVLRNAVGPRQDLILARLHGEKVEFTGVIAGMSGSPVYVEDRLIGALSYRVGAFGKEPIAGITPIADMLRLGTVAGAAAGGPVAAMPPVPAADLLGGFLHPEGDGGRPPQTTGWASGTAAQGGADGLSPIGMPLVCSGCDAAVLRYYAPIFEQQGLEPLAGGGTVDAQDGLPLEPGAPVGAALVTGDLSITGIGTLTHVDGSRVYAFGHPFLGAGALEAPMTQAQVLATFPSVQASFKIANATHPVGRIVYDGLSAIVGELGRDAPTIPVAVRVKAPSGERDFHFAIIRHRSWSPVLVALTLANSLTRTTEYDPGMTLRLRSTIDVAGLPPVRVEELYAPPSPAVPVHMALANEAAAVFGLLYNNRFEVPDVRGVDLEVELLPGSRVASITSLRASASDVRPGDTLTVTAVVTPFRGADRQVRWDVVLPQDMPSGDAQIVVGSGPAIDGLDRAVLQRRIAQAGNMRDLAGLIGRLRNSYTLYLRMTRRSPSAIVRSEVLADLPLSIFTVYNNPRLSTDVTLMIQAPILEIPQEIDWVVTGGRRIAIKVR